MDLTAPIDRTLLIACLITVVLDPPSGRTPAAQVLVDHGLVVPTVGKGYREGIKITHQGIAWLAANPKVAS